MNGIFGCIGKSDCKTTVINALQALQRYQSKETKICFKVGNAIVNITQNNNDKNLKADVNEIKGKTCYCGIGELTCLPQSFENDSKKFALAIGGSIENFSQLKKQCPQPFKIGNDSDLILAMLAVLNSNDHINSAKKISEKIENCPPFLIMPNDDEAIYCSAGNGEILIGIDKSNFYICNDMQGIIGKAQKYTYIENGEFAKITKDKLIIFDTKLKKTKKSFSQVPNDCKPLHKTNTHEDILQCPVAIKNIYSRFVTDGQLNFDKLKISSRRLDKAEKIIITGEGSAFASAKIGENAFKMLSDIPTYAYPAGELCLSREIVTKSTILIAIDSGGDNEKTIECARQFKTLGSKIIGILQNDYNPLARQCNGKICTNSTATKNSLKGFVASTYALLLFALYIGQKNESVSQLYASVALKMAEMLSGKIASTMKGIQGETLHARQIAKCKKILVAGQGIDYGVCIECAQKLNMLANANATACFASALCEFESDLSQTLIIAPITTKYCAQKIALNLKKAKAMGAKIIIITGESIADELDEFENIITFNDSVPLFNCLICACEIYKIALLTNEIESRAIDEKVS